MFTWRRSHFFVVLILMLPTFVILWELQAKFTRICIAKKEENVFQSPIETDTDSYDPGVHVISTPDTRIALLVPLTTPLSSVDQVSDLTLLNGFVPSLLKSIPESALLHSLELFIGIPESEESFKNDEVFLKIGEVLTKLQEESDVRVLVRYLFVPEYARERLPWMWNFLAQEAFNEGCDYFYQLLDIVRFSTPWADEFIHALQTSPLKPGFGIAGASLEDDVDGVDDGGVIEYAFVHRSHFEIFGAFFPTTADNMYCSDFASHVYGFQSTFWFSDVLIKQETEKPMNDVGKKDFVDQLIKQGRLSIVAWLNDLKVPEEKFVVESHYCRWNPGTQGKPKLSDHRVSRS